MRRLAGCAGCCVLAALVCSEGAAASGLGGFITAAAGTTEGGSESRAGAGLALDPGLGSVHRLHYRVKIAYEQVKLRDTLDPYEDDWDSDGDYDEGKKDGRLHGVVTDHLLGWRLLGGPGTPQLWAGPSARLGWLSGLSWGGPALGAGLDAVLDVPLGHDLTLSLSAGYRGEIQWLVFENLGQRLVHAELYLFRAWPKR